MRIPSLKSIVAAMTACGLIHGGARADDSCLNPGWVSNMDHAVEANAPATFPIIGNLSNPVVEGTATLVHRSGVFITAGHVVPTADAGALMIDARRHFGSQDGDADHGVFEISTVLVRLYPTPSLNDRSTLSSEQVATRILDIAIVKVEAWPQDADIHPVPLRRGTISAEGWYLGFGRTLALSTSSPESHSLNLIVEGDSDEHSNAFYDGDNIEGNSGALLFDSHGRGFAVVRGYLPPTPSLDAATSEGSYEDNRRRRTAVVTPIEVIADQIGNLVTRTPLAPSQDVEDTEDFLLEAQTERPAILPPSQDVADVVAYLLGDQSDLPAVLDYLAQKYSRANSIIAPQLFWPDLEVSVQDSTYLHSAEIVTRANAIEEIRYLFFDALQEYSRVFTCHDPRTSDQREADLSQARQATLDLLGGPGATTQENVVLSSLLADFALTRAEMIGSVGFAPGAEEDQAALYALADAASRYGLSAESNGVAASSESYARLAYTGGQARINLGGIAEANADVTIEAAPWIEGDLAPDLRGEGLDSILEAIARDAQPRYLQAAGVHYLEDANFDAATYYLGTAYNIAAGSNRITETDEACCDALNPSEVVVNYRYALDGALNQRWQSDLAQQNPERLHDIFRSFEETGVVGVPIDAFDINGAPPEWATQIDAIDANILNNLERASGRLQLEGPQ